MLVGPPGAGKSTVGRLVAARLGVGLLDSDQVVQATAGRTVAEIFLHDGETAFRAMEEQAVGQALRTHPGVLSLGGGAVLSARTRTALAGHTVVFLKVGMAEGVRRTGLSSARPLLAGVNPRATFATLLQERLPLYSAVATVTVETDKRPVAQVVEAVLTGLGDSSA